MERFPQLSAGSGLRQNETFGYALAGARRFGANPTFLSFHPASTIVH